MPSQLPLNIQLNDISTFTNFYNGNNQAVVKHLQDSLQLSDHPIIYIWGQEGTGKSHLLQASCHLAQQLNFSASYLPFTDFAHWQTHVLDGLELCDLICIDDIEQIAGQPLWEEACFNLYNRIQAAGKRLFISAPTLPQGLNLQLADLSSRLAWGLVLKVYPLADEDKLIALQLRAKNRGLQLSDEVARFLLQRCPRNMQNLFAALEKLDQASLAAQRRLTIPFIKQVLAL
jgi:DnaA family protein